MSKQTTSAKSRKAKQPEAADGGMDWAAFDALTDDEALAAAGADADAQPLADAELSRMRRVSLARHVRLDLGLSQSEFADAFCIPVGTLRDWEQHRTKPDQASTAYLRVIVAAPDVVRKALAKAPPSPKAA
jgi:putative transcriptional regulator